MLLWLLMTCSVLTSCHANRRRSQPAYELSNRHSASGLTPSTTPAGFIKVDFPLRNITKYEGESVRIRCEITGSPLPQYYWYKDDRRLSHNDKFNLKATHWGHRLKINNLQVKDTGSYACEGRNFYGSKKTVGLLTVKRGPNPNPRKKPKPTRHYEEDEEDLFNPEPPIQPPLEDVNPWNNGQGDLNGFCQPYLGNACGKFLGKKIIYVRSKLQQGNVEERLTAATTLIATLTDLTSRCGQYAVQTLCVYEVPLCDDTSASRPLPRKLCRDECEALETDHCVREYLKQGSGPGSNYGKYFWLPKCQTLPQIGSKESEKCVRVGLPVKGRVNPDHNCYNSSGKGYHGLVSQTESGLECQRWSSKTPHSHTFSVASFPELGDHNYCRNPDNRRDGPWCFTTNPNVEWEPCAIPACAALHSSSLGNMMMILIPSITVPVVIIILIIIICVLRNRNRHPGKGFKQPHQQMELNMVTSKLCPKAREFGISSLRFYQELGENNFGKVYRGELVGYYNDKAPAGVAVKTLKDRASNKLHKEFRKEMEVVAELKHPNISCLLGVVSREEPFCMIYEYLPYGNLHEYLLCHSPHSDVSASDDNGTDHVLDASDMTHMIVQVAAGMDYLSSHKIIHKDLATRNILVGETMTVKISDLGVNRDIYTADYFRTQGKEPWPIRWMSPEAICQGQFTAESDVWSYGVVLWEVFSYGTQPYYGYTNPEVIEMVRARQILPCPEDCPARIYSLMVECWHEMPIRRPSFREIYSRLRTWKCDVYSNPSVALSLAHSTSTQHSNHSGSGPHSHHSSNGPSNTTGTTPVSFQGPVINSFPNHSGCLPRPVIHPLPNPLPPPPIPPHHPFMMTRMPVLPMANGGMYHRPSPPGSIASHKSSSVHSDASPTSSVNIPQYRFTAQNNLNSPHGQQNLFVRPHYHTNKMEGNGVVPCGNGMSTFGQSQHPTPTSPTPLLGETRTSDI